jgi:GDP-mannose 6-dehydrogenase
MLGNVMGSNRAHVDHALELVTAPGKRRIGMVGLSFKAGTDDLRESPLVTVAERLIGKGYDLRIYDPEVNLSRLLGANKRYIETSIPHIGSLMSEDCAEVVRHAEVLVLGLGGKHVLPTIAGNLKAGQVVVDLVGVPQGELGPASYVGACW